ELVGDLLATIVHAPLIVPAHRLGELHAAHVDWRQPELVAHAGLAPKRMVPRRTSVAPSSTAISKSLDIPIESAVASCPQPRSVAAASRAPAKTRRSVLSSASSGAIAITPRTRRPVSAWVRSPSACSIAVANPRVRAPPTPFACQR